VNRFWPILPLFVVPVLIIVFFAPGRLSAQIETIGSEHLLVRIPADRSAIARDLVSELERCYVFMHRSTGNSLPRKVVIVVSWDQTESNANRQNSYVTVGMRHPSASADPKGFLLHRAAKELARLGLLELSGGAQREDTEFLFEGMTEILVHEYQHSSKSLEGAWAISRFLDDMKLLGVATQRSWTTFSSGNRCFRSAAPGITLLTTYRELLGREAPIKFFEALKKNSLTASLVAAFRAPATEVENTWVKKVREYQPVDEITISAGEVPQLLQTALVPGTVKPGAELEMQLFFKTPKNNLLPEGVFVRDERTGRVLQPQATADKIVGNMVLRLPVDPACPPGDYKYMVTAIDESGNLRNWTGIYKVKNTENTD